MQLIKVLVLLIILLNSISVWSSGRRVALVIGNAKYQSFNSLSNPDNDARAIAAKLQSLGFDLVAANGQLTYTPVLDLTEDNFLLAINNFTHQAQDAEIALLYYAGHGMQFSNAAYLLPIDVPKDNVELIQRHAISLNNILEMLDGKAELTIAIFDACREIPELEPVTRSSGLGRNRYRGLGRIKADNGSHINSSRIIAYSGAAGQLVKDGAGRNSPYTAELLAQIDKNGQDVGDVFEQVAYNFGQKHGGQKPEMVNQGVPPNRYYFINKLNESSTTRPSTVNDNEQLEISFWNNIKDSNNVEFYSAYLSKFGNDAIYAPIARIIIQDLTKPASPPSADIEQRGYSQKVAAYLEKGRMYLYDKGRPERALSYFNKALDLDKQNKQIHYELGAANIKLFEYAEAIEHLKAAIKLDPKYTAAYEKLADSYSALGDNAKAAYYKQYY